MKNIKKTKEKVLDRKSSVKREDLLGEFIATDQEVKKLRELSPVEKVQFEHDIAISHLYNSSKIEGSKLNETQLDKAIHA